MVKWSSANLKGVFAGLVILILFVGSGYFSQVHQDTLLELLGDDTTMAMFIYVVGATIATVIAPLSFLPAMPIAVALWGSFVAAVLSIIAWTLGAAIAFLLARKYGRPLVRRFVGEKKMAAFSELIPKKYFFVAVICMRIALPVDLLSYVLGLLEVIRFWPYLAATIIGITPFAFTLSYLAEFSPVFQAGTFLIAIIFIMISYPYLKKRYKKIFIDSKEEASH